MRRFPHKCHLLSRPLTSTLHQLTRKGVSTSAPYLSAITSEKLLPIDDIRRAISPVFTQGQNELRTVQWAGVFGSYARNEQQEDSDIDFLVGFKAGTSWDDVYQVGYTLDRALPEATKKEVDVLYMRNMEMRGYVMLEALLHAKTIYGDDSWLIANRVPAVKYVIDGYQKLQKALSLECEILQKMESMTAEYITLPQNASEKLDLIHLMAQLCDALSFESEHPFGGYFSPISDWIVDKRGLVERIRNSADSSVEVSDLWNTLDRELETRKRYLKKVYIPIVMETIRLAHTESSGNARLQLDSFVRANN